MRAVTFDPATDRFAVRDCPSRTWPRRGAGPRRGLRIEPRGCQDHLLETRRGRHDRRLGAWSRRRRRDRCAGPGVDGWRPGDRVLYHGNMFRPHGGFAEFAIHAAATLTPHPNVAAVEAAATPCAAWTAYRSLVDKLHVQPGQSLLVIGGAGGVGSFAVQFARYLGMNPIIATCSAHNFDLVRQFGATDVLDYHEGEVGKRVRA